MDFKPLEKAEIQLFQALQDFPPPAQQSTAIIQRVAEILETSPAPQQELTQLKERAWSLYVDSRQDNRQIHIHQTYNISNSFNQNCWNDDHSDRSQTTTTTAYEFDIGRGLIYALIAGSLFLIVSQQAYLDGIRDRRILQEVQNVP